MAQSISFVALVVPDYDLAIDFYVHKLGFDLIEDTPKDGKRWVVVAPPGATETRLLLAKAVTPAQKSAIGNQTGGRVFLFLNTDSFKEDVARMSAIGVHFEEEPRLESYGKVVVWQDPFGNRWDLLQLA